MELGKIEKPKSDKATLMLRVRSIIEYFVKGYSYNDIVTTCSKNWNVEDRTVKGYIEKAYVVIKEDINKDIEQDLHWHLKCRLDTYRDLMKERDSVLKDTSIKTVARINTAMAVQKQMTTVLIDMAKLSGLYVERVKIEGQMKTNYVLPDGTTIEI